MKMLSEKLKIRKVFLRELKRNMVQNNQIKSKHRVANHGEVFTMNGSKWYAGFSENETERLDSEF